MDKRISELNVATALTGTEVLPIVQGGETKKVTAKAISELGGAVSIGQVAFGTAAGVIGGDAGFTWDNVNKRLGVGTSTPTARLHVQASGALSTDIAFRVRNSADTFDIIRAQGDGSVFIGQGAGNSNTVSNNIFIGNNAGRDNIDTLDNVFVGFNAGRFSQSSQGSFFGNTAGQNTTTGSSNSFFGFRAGIFNNTGSGNSAFGVDALRSNTTGNSNTANGVNAGRFIADGTTANAIANNSVYLGNNTKALANNQTNQIVIGDSAIGAGSNTVTLGNTSIIKTILRGTLNAANLPTSATGLVAGDIWNDAGTLKIV
jgi:hypothetical protein